MSRIVRVYFVMVHGPRPPSRVGNAYALRETAASWGDFAAKACRCEGWTVEALDLEWEGGRLSAATLDVLDRRYNLDPPAGTQEE